MVCMPDKLRRGSKNGKVYAVNRDDTVRLKTVTSKLIEKDIDHFLTPDENIKYLLYQWQPKLQNNRIIAQQSIFLFSGAQIEEDAKCVIDKDSKQDILTFLEQISGITEGSIYPDFDGFARLYAHDKPYIEPDPIGFWVRGIYAHQANDLDDAIEYLHPSHTVRYGRPFYCHRSLPPTRQCSYRKTCCRFSHQRL